jgi:ribosomal protein L37AE/L43A
MSETTPRHAPPFFCPYCGEEDLVPAGPDAGDWECRSCTRAFSLRTLVKEGA